MFFGRELNTLAFWALEADANKARQWIANRSTLPVTVWPRKDGGFNLSLGWLGMRMITVGYLSALMQRHDKPPVLVPYMMAGGIRQSRDVADVPFMAALPFYDVLPKERPNVEPAAR